MQASHALMVSARVMVAIFVGLAIWSLIAMVRSFYKPLDATPEKLATFKKNLLLSSWVTFAGVGVGINALASKQYYLLWASATLFSFVLPILVHYVRLRRALRKQPTSRGLGPAGTVG